MFHGGSANFAGFRGTIDLRADMESSAAGKDGPGVLFPGPEGRLKMLGPSGGDAKYTQEAIARITAVMVGPNDRDEALSEIPAAFTYFGQFVFHDIVFSRLFGVPDGARPLVANAVSFGLDLSGLYGRGPDIDGYLYDVGTAPDFGTCKFPLGLPCARGSNLPIEPGSASGRDLPRLDTKGSFIVSAGGSRPPYRPLVADPRNDDNLILSQLLVTLMRTHNRLVDIQLVNKTSDASTAYARARRFMTGAYRRIVIHDYLRRLLHPKVWSLFFREEGDFRGPGVSGLRSVTALPVEFTFGAARFAHAMVRHIYRVNDEFEEVPGELRQLLTFSSLRDQGDVPVPVNWLVDWNRLIGDGMKVQRARRISPFLSPSLTDFPMTSDGTHRRPTPFMDIWRCYDLGVLTGQAVAQLIHDRFPELGVDVLSDSRMLPTPACIARNPYHAEKLRVALLRERDFLTSTPLSYYILQEASDQGEDGKHLGPVGSYIIGATLAAALFLARDSEVQRGDVNAAGDLNTLHGLLELHDPGKKTDADLINFLGL